MHSFFHLFMQYRPCFQKFVLSFNHVSSPEINYKSSGLRQAISVVLTTILSCSSLRHKKELTWELRTMPLFRILMVMTIPISFPRTSLYLLLPNNIEHILGCYVKPNFRLYTIHVKASLLRATWLLSLFVTARTGWVVKLIPTQHQILSHWGRNPPESPCTQQSWILTFFCRPFKSPTASKLSPEVSSMWGFLRLTSLLSGSHR